MPNQIPLSGVTPEAGGVLLPPEQGEILVNGILVETGAIQLAGDARSTSARKTTFPIWLGRPTAGPVGEGGSKGVTGASFGSASLNIKKFASIILFTDEQIEDLQNGDLNVLADAGVRQALSVAIDAHAVNLSGGSNIEGGSVFDSPLLPSAGPGITLAGTTGTEIQKGISAALNTLEENGYGNPDDIGVLLGFGFQQPLRDARDGNGRPLYDGGQYAGQTIDPLYGLDRAHSTNLTPLNAAALTFKGTTVNANPTITITTRGTAPLFVGQPISGTNIPANSVIKAKTGADGKETAVELGKWENGAIVAVNATATEATPEAVTVKKPVGLVAHKPNIHVRVRKDVTIKVSNEASVEVKAGEIVSLFQNNLTAILYETRLGFLVHDSTRSLVPLWI
jgi:hypothetical protein